MAIIMETISWWLGRDAWPLLIFCCTMTNNRPLMMLFELYASKAIDGTKRQELPWACNRRRNYRLNSLNYSRIFTHTRSVRNGRWLSCSVLELVVFCVCARFCLTLPCRLAPVLVILVLHLFILRACIWALTPTMNEQLDLCGLLVTSISTIRTSRRWLVSSSRWISTPSQSLYNASNAAAASSDPKSWKSTWIENESDTEQDTLIDNIIQLFLSHRCPTNVGEWEREAHLTRIRILILWIISTTMNTTRTCSLTIHQWFRTTGCTILRTYC